MRRYLGLPLALALQRLAALGIHPEVTYTKAARHPIETGEARVIRVDEEGKRLLAAVFPAPLRDEPMG